MGCLAACDCGTLAFIFACIRLKISADSLYPELMEVKDRKRYGAHKPFPTVVNLSFTFQLRSFFKESKC